ncbi:helix-turn-helix domain-containing protein [[Mycobacterium] crassicus]|uniref:Helix-turn-helix domain-containing protein n=1 Tax=[Mycobacterium] crassicus TaxID=2872309 RepID=A0ABU5XG71_9MYCO|nr:helix-turn-helix domain-containing protein [Mycolicibacter sp. MYC098]MEB3021275.1 helix-turn-helix domain-containing protein [Mycolicibacter sp. MYC098]
MPEPKTTGANPSQAALDAANRQRNATLTPRIVEFARIALDTKYELLSDRERFVAQLRVDHPTDTLTQLAERAEITKDACSSALRRAVQRAQLGAEAVSA